MLASSRTALRQAASKQLSLKTGVRTVSAWSQIPQGPPDAILGITEAFKADSNPEKINLGVGAYRDDKGKPFVLPSVRQAEKKIVESSLDKEYAGITGVPAFTKAALQLAYGPDSAPIKEDRVVITQSISGTGALRIGGAFLERFYPGAKTIYIPNPSWANHNAVFKDSGLKVEKYRYYNKDTIGLDFEGLIADIKAMPKGSIVLLHACAHNPTGVDPTQQQWHQIASVVKDKNHFVLFDNAYQGFASGDLDRDAYAVRHFLQCGLQFIVTQSFAKNFGLYAERIGACSVVTDSRHEASCVRSQLKLISRATFSNPPIHGALIVSIILSNDELTSLWKSELSTMAERIIRMRKLLLEALQANGTPGDWQHIVNQIGMFSYTGLTARQVEQLTKRHSVYLTADGRISMAGLSAKTCPVLADAIKDVITNP